MYKFTEKLSKKEYDLFYKNYKLTPSFMQDYNWSSVKDNWNCFHCGLYKNKKLVAVCTILEKRIFKNITMFYVPRGFLIDYENYDDLYNFTVNIKKLAKKNNAYVVKIDPNYCTNEFGLENENIPINYSNNYVLKNNNLKKCGYKIRKVQKKMSKSFQPQYNVFAPTIDIENVFLTDDLLLKSYPQRFRNYFKGFLTKRGISYLYTQDIEYLDDFIDLIKCTEQKQKIQLRNKEYFKKIMTLYKENSYLFFGTIDLKKYLDFLLNNNGKTEEINIVKDFINKNIYNLKLSTALVILPKNKAGIRTSEYLYAGNSKYFTNLKVSAGLVYEIIKFSRNNKCHYCNLGGVEGTLDDNLTYFKRKFNGIAMEFTGECDLPINILYYPIRIFYPLLLKIYKFILKIKKKIVK